LFNVICGVTFVSVYMVITIQVTVIATPWGGDIALGQRRRSELTHIDVGSNGISGMDYASSKQTCLAKESYEGRDSVHA